MWRTSRGLARAGIPHGFSTANLGDFRKIDLPPATAVARQVHGRTVLVAHAPGRSPNEADALWSGRRSGIASPLQVGVLTADCVPLLLADPGSGLVAAVHAGWRGTLARVLTPAVEALVAEGAELRRLQVAIGPAIRACCYQVSPQLLDDFAQAFGPEVVGAGDRLDLVRANLQQLLALGIPAEGIEDLAECTHCATDSSGEPRYFSHRRDPVGAGRQLSFVGPGVGPAVGPG